jgi:peptide/nickel transport system permease protein
MRLVGNCTYFFGFSRMLQYLVRRLLIALLTLMIVTTLGYMLIRFIPGDPATIEVESASTKIKKENTERMRRQLGLDKPWYVGYSRWLVGFDIFDREELHEAFTDGVTRPGGLIHGNLGMSISEKRSVAESIGLTSNGENSSSRILNTLLLSGTSLVLAYLLSVPLGLYTTATAGTKRERFISTSLYMLYSLPAFVAAILLQSWFSVSLRDTAFELPLFNMKSNDYQDLGYWGQIWDVAKHMILPVFCYTYGSLAYETRFIKANMAEVVRQDYIRTARAKGVSEWMILWKHGFRNTLIPFVTLIGLTFPTLLSGSVILEQIFNWPGMGQLLFNAFTARDYPLIMGVLLMFSVMTLLGQLLADLLYAWADPRISYS